jgi:prevent-host-death family protein
MLVQENMHQAKTHFSKLVKRALNGDEVIVAKAGVPLVKLVPVTPETPRKAGCLKGFTTSISDDFDAPLDDMREYME